MPEPCEHFDAIRPVAPRSNDCAACRALGARWNELRLCLNCGHVGCCEDSPHAHALQHFRSTGHPLIASFEPADTWGWCYVHRRYFDPLPGRVPKRRSALSARLASLLARLRRRSTP